METAIKNDAFINQKLISWEGNVKINVHGADISFNYGDQKSIILKISNVCKAEISVYFRIEKENHIT